MSIIEGGGWYHKWVGAERCHWRRGESNRRNTTTSTGPEPFGCKLEVQIPDDCFAASLVQWPQPRRAESLVTWRTVVRETLSNAVRWSVPWAVQQVAEESQTFAAVIQTADVSVRGRLGRMRFCADPPMG